MRATSRCVRRDALLRAGAAMHRHAQQEHQRAQDEQRARVGARARERRSAVALKRPRPGGVAAVVPPLPPVSPALESGVSPPR